MLNYISKIMNSYSLKKKFLKINENIKLNSFLKKLISLNIIKYVFKKNGNITIFYSYNNKNVKYKNFLKISNKKYISVDELKKITILKKTIVFVSTNVGLLSNKEALAKNSGGLLVMGLYIGK